MKDKKLLFLITLFIFSIIACSSRKPVEIKHTPVTKKMQRQGVRRIVIDAGHGGTDYGAGGKYSYEKDISLSVALMLEAEIKKQIPTVEVYMTRTTDVFDDPRLKADKANAAKGDLFISIHCNSSNGIRHRELDGYRTVKYKSKGKTRTKKVARYKYYTTPSPAKGTETYIWGIDKNDDKLQALIDNENVYSDSTMLMDKQSLEDPEQIASISLRMQQYADRSRNLAYSVQNEFTNMGRVNRDAKQRAKGIWVLQAVAMPAVLIELGFISNPEEEDYLNSVQGQKELAESIARAVKQYKLNIEARMNHNNR